MRRKTGTGSSLVVKNACCLMSSYTASVKTSADGVQPALQIQLNDTRDSLLNFTVSSLTNKQDPARQHSNEVIGTAHLSFAQRYVQRLQSTAQHSTAQHSTAQHSPAQHLTSPPAQHSTAQHDIAQQADLG